jgi:hypothetical protein
MKIVGNLRLVKLLMLFGFLFIIGVRSARTEWISPGSTGIDISAQGDTDTPWFIGQDNRIYLLVDNHQSEYPGGGHGLAIAVSPGGTPWIIGMDNNIYFGTGSGWKPAHAWQAKDIALDGDGQPWILGMDNLVYRYTGSKWIKYPSDRLGLAIAVSYDGTPWVIGMDKKVYGGLNMSPISGPDIWPAKDIALDSRNLPWIIGPGNALFHYNGKKWTRYSDNYRAYRLALSLDKEPSWTGESPLIIGLDKRIYRGHRRGNDESILFHIYVLASIILDFDPLGVSSYELSCSRSKQCK